MSVIKNAYRKMRERVERMRCARSFSQAEQERSTAAAIAADASTVATIAKDAVNAEAINDRQTSRLQCTTGSI